MTIDLSPLAAALPRLVQAEVLAAVPLCCWCGCASTSL